MNTQLFAELVNAEKSEELLRIMKSIERFVDAHIHLWILEKGWYPMLESRDDNEYGCGDNSSIVGRDFLIPDYLEVSKSVNVTKLVHVTAAHAEVTGDMTKETRWLQSLADTQDIPIAIVGWTDLKRTIAEIKAELKVHAECEGFRGIRNHEIIDFTSDHTFSAFEVMQEMGLIYDTVTHQDTLKDAANLAARFPGMHFALEHTGWPTDKNKQTFQAWCEGMDAFATLPNTSCKISGLGMFLHEWTVEDFRPWVLYAIEAFGTDRCMFATNFPVDSIFSSYDALVGAFNEITQGFSDSERDAMFAANAERIYRI